MWERRAGRRTPWLEKDKLPPLHDDIPPPLPPPPASPFSTSVAPFCVCGCVMKATGALLHASFGAKEHHSTGVQLLQPEWTLATAAPAVNIFFFLFGADLPGCYCS